MQRKKKKGSIRRKPGRKPESEMTVTKETLGKEKRQEFLPEPAKAKMPEEKKQSLLDTMRQSRQYQELQNQVTELLSALDAYLESADKRGMTMEVTRSGLNNAIQIQNTIKLGEGMRKAVTKPLLDAKKQVDDLFKDVFSDISDYDTRIRKKLIEAAYTLKQTTRFPGIGTLVVQPVPTVIVLNLEEVPENYKEVRVNESKVREDVESGVDHIPGLLIEKEYRIQVRGVSEGANET